MTTPRIKPANLTQLRRAPAATWEAVNPVLMDGEPGYAQDTGVLKVGDGVSRWSALAAVSGGSGGSGSGAESSSLQGLFRVGHGAPVVTEADRDGGMYLNINTLDVYRFEEILGGESFDQLNFTTLQAVSNGGTEPQVYQTTVDIEMNVEISPNPGTVLYNGTHLIMNDGARVLSDHSDLIPAEDIQDDYLYQVYVVHGPNSSTGPNSGFAFVGSYHRLSGDLASLGLSGSEAFYLGLGNSVALGGSEFTDALSAPVTGAVWRDTQTSFVDIFGGPSVDVEFLGVGVVLLVDPGAVDVSLYAVGLGAGPGTLEIVDGGTITVT